MGLQASCHSLHSPGHGKEPGGVETAADVAVGRAGGFANSMLLRQRSSLPLEEEAAPADRGGSARPAPTTVTVQAGHDEALKATLVDKAAAVRDITGAAIDRGITLREVLKGGALRGQPVFFQSRHGDLLLNGARIPSISLLTQV